MLKGGGIARADVDMNQLEESVTDFDRLEQLNGVLIRFEAIEPDKAHLVKLLYFAGLKIREVAMRWESLPPPQTSLGVCRAWLQTEMNDELG